MFNQYDHLESGFSVQERKYGDDTYQPSQAQRQHESMSTYSRGVHHPNSTWWDKPPQRPQLNQVFPGPVAFAILEEAVKDGNTEVVKLMNMPTERDMLKQSVAADSEQPRKHTGPQFSHNGGITVPGVNGGLVVALDDQDPLVEMRKWVRKQVSKNTGMRPQDIHFKAEKPQEKKKKDPVKRTPMRADDDETVAVKDKTETVVVSPAAGLQVGDSMARPKVDKVDVGPRKIALMFPGQGSQYVKMLSEAKDDPQVKDYCDVAQRILGYDLLNLCLHGPETELEDTKQCQPALFLASMAGLEKLRRLSPEVFENNGFSCVAGLSLGEYTALCVAGVFTFEQGMSLVKVRADAMSEAAAAVPGTMVSVAGLEREQLEKLCQGVSDANGDKFAAIANELFPKGFGCSGTADTIDELKKVCLDAGAMQAKVLKTSGAFHTKLMLPAQGKLEEELQKMLPDMCPPKCDIYMNYTGQVIKAGTDPSEIVPLLAQQLSSPVLWHQSVALMIADGHNEFYEIGPMKQLKAMMKRIDPTMWSKTTNVDV